MSAEQLTALAAVIAAVGGIVAVVLGFLNRRAARNAEALARTAAVAATNSQREIIATKDGIRILGERIDGQLDKLLAGARAEGHAAGEQAQRDRANPADAT